MMIWSTSLMNEYKTTLVLNIAVFILMIGDGMVVALLPAKIITLTGSPALVGYLAAVFAAAYLLFQIPAGRLADKIGFRLPIGAGFIICGLAGILFYRADSGVEIFVGRALQGIGEIPVWAMALALLSRLFPKSKGRAMGYYNASVHLGLSAGPFIGIWLERFFQDPKAPFQFYFISSLAGGLLIWMLARNPDGSPDLEKSAATTISLYPLLKKKHIQVSLMGVILYGAGYGLFITLIPAYLICAKRFTTNEIGVYFTLFYTAISLVQVITGRLSDRYGRKGFMVSGLFLALVGIVLFPDAGKIGAMAMLMSSGFGLGMFYVSSAAHLNETVGMERKGMISGLYFLAWGAGYFMGPLLVGIIGIHAGMPICFQAYGCLLFLQIVFMFLWTND